MYITLTDTWENKVQKAIEIGKENDIPVVFLRDGTHGTADLNVLLAFQRAGFTYDIEGYKSRYDKEAIKVTFHYIRKDDKNE